MEIESALVAGANRGIGLEFVKQLVKLPNPPRFVFASYRDESTTQALKEIRDGCTGTQVVLVKMDIAKMDEVESARKVIEEKLGDKGLNLVINNAGINKLQGFPKVTGENLLLHFSTNTVGPVNVVKEMLPLLQKAAAQKPGGMNASRASVLNISAMGGSIAKVEPEPKIFLSAMGYRVSKAALHMAMRIISLTVKDQGILIVSMCPGWVKTDMGSNRATLTTEESVLSMLKTLSQLNEEHHGTFMDRNGEISEF